MESNDAGGKDATRFGGAAADFITSLGRKAAELRPAIDALAHDPTHRVRDELRRKLHALGVGARLLHFTVLAQSIAAATRRLDEAAAHGKLSRGLVLELQALVERLPELAFQKGNTVPPPPVAEVPAEPVIPVATPSAPWTVLVIGPETLALALEDDPQTLPCEIERTSEVETAPDLARAVAPDLLVVDVDLPGAFELIVTFTDDVLTGPVPIVAIGEHLSDRVAKLVALGVAKVMEKPVAGVTLREACSDVVGERSRVVPAALHPELGELTVGELVVRLEEELHRLLLDPLEAAAIDRKVKLGTGAEILGPFWGALARARDVLRDKSQGAIGFLDDRVRRPIAVAPMGESLTERRTPRRGSLEVDLEGRVVVVADDDPSVADYVGSVLGGAGATVLLAADGEAALSLSRHERPAAIVSDVLMPQLDGIGLARALRRDVELRDRPVILLSWKEDLLQRLRDLRVDSNATLRKDDDAATIVARVREVLAPRVRIEARIAGGAEVRGRLDDLTVTSLLTIADAVRKEALVIVRDAAHVYEVELDGGGIRRLSRTGTDGSFVRGLGVLPSLLGVIGGRFLVRPIGGRIDSEPLVGDLEEQLRPVLRELRAATDAVSNPMELAAIGLEPSSLASYLTSTPPTVRRLLERLAEGASPRTLVLSGDVSPSTLEDVLADAASRGLVVRATSVKGLDYVQRARERLAHRPSPSTPAPAPRTPFPSSVREIAAEPTPIEFSLESIAPPAPVVEETDSATPQSLTDAVLQVASPGSSTSKRPIIDTRELRPRPSSNRSDPPPHSSSRGAFSGTPTPRPRPATRGVSEPRVETLHGVQPKPPQPSSDPDTMPPPSREPKKPSE